jgi:cell division protein FtsW (lipid II flippase)
MAFVGMVARPRRNVELALLVVVVALVTFGDADLGLATTGRVPADLPFYAGGLAAAALLVHLMLRWRARYADPVILPIATAINGIGLVVIHRLDLANRAGTASVVGRQWMWTAVGVVLAAAVVWLVADHRTLARFTYTAMAAGLGLLLLPLAPVVGRSVNGARIWIAVGSLSFQPGELAKILIAVFFAGYLVTARDSLSLIGRKVVGVQLPRARDLGPLLIVWLTSLIVLMFETDLGMSLLYFGLFVAMLYVATERTSWVFIGLILFAGGSYLAWTLFSHIQVRVTIWLHPFDPANADRAYQLIQGLYGMASGGLLGTGLGKGSPQIVPFANSDFIVASIGEELGLTGLLALLTLYLVLVERGLRTAIGVRDSYGKLLAAGLSFSIALQVFVVVGGITRVIPLAGLTMPFLAAGGSSLVSNWIIVALLLRISDAARRPQPATETQPTAVVATNV